MDAQRRSEQLNQAQRLIQQRRYDQAFHICQALLDNDESDADAHKLVGYTYYIRGFFNEALAHFTRASELLPTAPDVFANLGKVLTQMGRTEESDRAFDEALRLQPRFPEALEGKAELLVMTDRNDEAYELLLPMAGSAEETPRIAQILAEIERQKGRPEQSIEHARRLLDRPTTPPMAQRRLCFEIGRAFDDMNKYDEAFAAFAKGNACDAHPFNPREHEASVTELMRVFSRKNLKQMQRSSVDSDAPVFVTGMPRSGTTLVEQIIDAHPEAHGAGELNILPEIVKSIQDRLGTQRPYPQCAQLLTRKSAAMLGQAYLDFILPLAPGARRIVDKALRTYPHIGLLHLILPNARMIHCRRDPMDTCLSCFMASLSPSRHPYIADLSSLGFYYRQYDRLMRHWREVGIDMLEVQYEELVMDQERVSRKIIDFCDLDWDPRCLRFHESGRLVLTLSYDQVRRPLYTSAIGRYKKYEKHLGLLRAALSGTL